MDKFKTSTDMTETFSVQYFIDKILWTKILKSYKFYVQNFVDKIVCRQIIQIFKASFSKSVADSYIFYSHKVFPIQMCLGLCSICPSKHCVKFSELYCATLSKCSSKLQTFNTLRETVVKYKQKNDKEND